MENLGRKIKLISQQIKYRMDKETEEIGITYSQVQVLRYLEKCENEKVTQKRLANEFNVKHSTMAGILQRMLEKDLIRIEVDQDNKKFKNIYLTKNALEIKEQIEHRIKFTESVLIKDIEKNEVELIHKLLDKIHENLINENQWK